MRVEVTKKLYEMRVIKIKSTILLWTLWVDDYAFSASNLSKESTLRSTLRKIMVIIPVITK